MKTQDDTPSVNASVGTRLPLTVIAILIAVGWFVFIIIWNSYASDSAAVARSFAVFSSLAVASVLTLRVQCRSYAFTAWVLTFVLAAFCFPNAFVRWGEFDLKKLIVPLIQIIMFGMGATLAVADFTRVFKMPRAVLIGMALQFTIMPLVGFVLTKAFNFEPSVAAGVILIGSCPGGVASNVMTYLSKGNVALSVTMTACSTCIAPIMTSLLMSILAGTLVEIVFLDWVVNIFQIIIIPIAIGLIVNSSLIALKMRGAWLDRCLSIIAMAGICLIIGIIIGDSRDKLLSVGATLVAAAVLHNSLGYLLGYGGARLARLDESSCRTVAIEVGLQNGGMATALAINTIKDPLAALAPAIFGPWMNISGSLLASWWGAHPPTDDRPENPYSPSGKVASLASGEGPTLP